MTRYGAEALRASQVIQRALYATFADQQIDPEHSNIAKIMDKVSTCHLENHRDYHNILHPYKMLVELELLIAAHSELKDAVDITLMTWLITHHDIVLKLGREKGWNEEQSAILAENHMVTLGFETSRIGPVVCGILCTIDHQISGVLNFKDPKQQLAVELFLDLDLAGLGQPPDEFQQDTEAVWREFRAIATREEYDAGRAVWAAEFLKRDRIYHTRYFADKRAQARTNLEALAK